MKSTEIKKLTPKEHARIIATHLREVATQFMKSNILPMPAGTYTAGDIHRHFNKACKNYNVKNLVPTNLFRKSKPIDVEEIKRIEHELGTVSFPWYHVFYYLWRFEKEAGWTGKKAHKFICRDQRNPVIESSIVFGCEKQIRKLSRMVSQFNVTDRKHCMLSLADGCISGTFSKQVWVNAKRTTQEYGGFTLTPTAFDVNPEVANLSVRITAAQLKHLYGECKLRIYKDEVPNGNADNPYRIQVMIENPDGWIIGSDIIETDNVDKLQDTESNSTEAQNRYSGSSVTINPEIDYATVNTALSNCRTDSAHRESILEESARTDRMSTIQSSQDNICNESVAAHEEENSISNGQHKRFYPIPRQLGDILAGDISMPLEKYQLPHTPEVLVREEPITNYHFTPPHRKMLELTTPPKVRYKLVPFKSRLKNSLRL